MKLLAAVVMSVLSSAFLSSCYVSAYNLRGTHTATPVPTESIYPSSAPSESFYHRPNPIRSSNNINTMSFLTSGAGLTGTTLATRVGQDFAPSFSKQDIYKGIKTNVGKDNGILMPKLFEYNPDNFINEVNQNSYAHSVIIQDSADIQDALDISGSLSVSYGPCSGSGAGEYLSKNSATKNSVTVLFKQWFTLYSTRPNNSYEVVDAVEDLIKEENYAAIASQYGTRFIDQIIYGAQLDMKFTVTSDSDVDVDEIDANLRGSIGEAPLSLDFEGRFQKSSSSSEAQYRMEIEASAIGVDLPVLPNPTFNQTLQIIANFTAAYEELRHYIDENGIDETSTVTKQLTPVAVSIIDTSEKIQQLSPFSKSIMEDRLSQNAISMTEILLTIGKLDAQQKFLKKKFPSGINRSRYYYRWYEKYDEFKNNVLNPKLQECEDFKRLNVTQLIASKPGDVPKPLSVQNKTVVDDLLGKGYVPAPVTLEGKTYNDMYWNDGYVLNGEPFFQGSLYCVKDDSQVGTQNTTINLARTIPTDACSNPTDSPTHFPTQPVTPEPQCNSRTPYCPSDGACCDSDDFRDGSTCHFDYGKGGSGCCNIIAYTDSWCMKCDANLTNCTPYFA